MRFIVVGTGFLALAACGGDPRSERIADIDFTSPSSVQAVSQKLNPSDRGIFGEYVMSRQMAGMTGIKEVGVNGKAPSSVGEAIDATRRRDDIFNKRNRLVAKQNAMLGSDGLTSASRPQWEAAGKQVDEYDRQLALMTVK